MTSKGLCLFELLCIFVVAICLALLLIYSALLQDPQAEIINRRLWWKYWQHEG